MFDTLIQGFQQAKQRLAGLTALTEANVEPALQEVRRSLLDADVELGVIKVFLQRVKEKAIGEVVRVRVRQGGQTLRVSAADQFVKLCHEEMVTLLSLEGGGPALRFASQGPTGILMVGLQGSGKTTTCAKLARYLAKQGKKVLLVAGDKQRPAAVEQLQILGAKIQVPVFHLPDASPLAVSQAALEEGKRLAIDVIVYDTAGRLAIDETLMQELSAIQEAVHPENILLVVDAMIGQDSVKVSRSFHERLGLSAVVLTKLDGDARGGAALSIREVTGVPVRFVGMGEGVDRFEEFRPEGMAGRVLGMGDVVGLMQDFEAVVDREKAEKSAEKILAGGFSLDDFLDQIRTIQQMGSLKELIAKMPGMGSMLPPGAEIDERELGRVEAMIQSLTRLERKDPALLVREPSRVRRVARGSGTSEKSVGEFVQKFLWMRQMLGGLGGQGGGLASKIPGLQTWKKVSALRKQMKQGMSGNPFAMPGMEGLEAMGGPMGMSPPSPPKPLSNTEKNAKKAARKREKDARKKGRK